MKRRLASWIPLFLVKVWADFGIFTKPDNKVDRGTTACITPSAARGVVESIYWKPQMHWEIHRIEVLNPIQFVKLRCNELDDLKPPRNGQPIYTQKRRTQRFSTYLHNPAYIIHAALVCPPEDLDKHWAIANRRLDKGQHHHPVRMGRKNGCLAFFERPSGEETPIPETRDLGTMLFDLTYGEPNRPIWFDAKLVNGVLEVPTELYQQVSFKGGN